MKIYKYFIAMVVCGLLLVLSQSNLIAAEQDKQAKAVPAKYELRWGTMTTGGAFAVIGNAMLEDVKKANPNIIGSTVPNSVTGNVMGVHLGKYNIGFTLSDTTASAWEGEELFKDTGPVRNIRELVALYPHVTQIVVRAKSDITKIEDLKGKRVSPGPKGSSMDLESQRLFRLYGMSYNDMKVQFLSFEDATSQFIDGHLDALLFLTNPIPFVSVVTVASQVPIRLIGIPDNKIAQMIKFRGVEAYTLPPNIYKGIDYPVKGIAVRAHCVVRDDMPDELAYAIVKTIAENYSRYPVVLKSMSYAKLEDMPRDVGIPLHPGALKYYKERGWVK